METYGSDNDTTKRATHTKSIEYRAGNFEYGREIDVCKREEHTAKEETKCLPIR